MQSATLMLQFIISGGGLLFLFFAVFSIFNKQGNRLLNRLFGFALFARFCQVFTYYNTLIGDTQTLYVAYPLNSLMQVVSPVFFFLYLQSFINDKSQLKPLQYLHFIPVVILFWDCISWFMLPTAEAEALLQGFVDRKQFFATQPNSIIPEAWQHPFRRGLSLIYLLVAWVFILKETRDRLWDVQKRWVYFLSSAMTINQVLLLVQYIIIAQGGGISQNLFLAPVQILLMIVLFGVLFYDPRLLYGQLLVSDKWRKPVHLQDLKSGDTEPEKQEEFSRRAPVDEEKIQHY